MPQKGRNVVEKIRVNVKKLKENASLPKFGTEYAAGADLYACIEAPQVIEPGKTEKVPAGISIELPEGTVGLIYARSGLALKKGLAPANKVGVIDCDYRGEIIVALHNHGDEAQTVEPGDRIAQLVVTPYLAVDYQECDELSETVRGEGGFGSTGSK